MKSDPDFQNRFEGSIRNGVIDGYFCHRSALWDPDSLGRYKFGYVNMTGTYDLNQGCLSLNLSPSNVFFVSFVWAFAIAIIPLILIDRQEDLIFHLAAGALGLGVALVQWIMYRRDKRKCTELMTSISSNTTVGS
ncbi:MAG: hypothetical protein AAF193_00225 [Bacteroidota bacterium]